MKELKFTSIGWRISYGLLQPSTLTLNLVGFLGVRFEVRWGKITLPPCLQLVRITLETLNLVRKYTHIFSF